MDDKCYNLYIYMYVMVFRVNSRKIKGFAEDSSLLPQKLVISLRYNGNINGDFFANNMIWVSEKWFFLLPGLTFIKIHWNGGDPVFRLCHWSSHGNPWDLMRLDVNFCEPLWGTSFPYWSNVKNLFWIGSSCLFWFVGLISEKRNMSEQRVDFDS